MVLASSMDVRARDNLPPTTVRVGSEKMPTVKLGPDASIDKGNGYTGFAPLAGHELLDHTDK